MRMFAFRIEIIRSVLPVLMQDPVSFHLFKLPVSPAFAAAGHVAVVAAYFHLSALSDDITVGIDSGVHYGLASACASGFHLIDSVGHLKEAF